ncbi:cag pathogenicity island protein [Helicobacter pylori]|nr:cag pathogenicity island protein [Helicobacter pylori]
MPHIATMGRDEILQQTPLKHPRSHQIRKTKFLRPITTTHQ